jgi:hypothetical protein
VAERAPRPGDGDDRTEKLFGDGSVLALDPATGSTFDLRDESSHGADSAPSEH